MLDHALDKEILFILQKSQFLLLDIIYYSMCVYVIVCVTSIVF